VIFEEETPLGLIKALSPDLIAKGDDDKKHQIVRADLVEENGGQVLIVDSLDGFSTTAVINSTRQIDSAKSSPP
jgi:D-beta-D-heptose 7-phosphate kinase/D-beta-D-heptose 1-phosphate adenosyltransferase